MRSNYYNPFLKAVTRAFVFIFISTAFFIAGSQAYGQTVTYSSDGSFTVPAGVTSITVEAWGAGGGGSRVTTNNRRGGGGGGGAYAKKIVTVVPGQTYSITVGTGGTYNTNGENSVFGSSLVVAAGGSGAAGNSVTGGDGGTVAASVGDTRYKGGDGADGAGSNSGGGGGGAGSTGAGNNASGATAGAARSLNGGSGGGGVAANIAGKNGLTYGGGGSGGNRSNASQNGGSGANGLIIINFSCNTYSLTSVSATGICSASPVSTITINSTSMPSGAYTVTYNLSSPNAATGLTANINYISGTPGSGSFNTADLSNTSSPTIVTISSLASGAVVGGTGDTKCLNSISSANTASININPAPSVLTTTPGSRCGTGSVTLSAAADAGAVIDWYAASSGGSVLSGGSATNTYNTPSITGTTTYYAQARNTTTGCISGRTAVIASINAIPAQPAVISTATICAGTDQVYSVTNVAGLTYSWTVPSGWTINSGQGTSSINVTTGTTSGVTLSVTPYNGSCVGTARVSSAIAIVTNTTPGAQPTSLSFTPTVSTLAASFTAASGSPTGYLVIRKENSTPPSAPVDGTTYMVGTVALGGIVDKYGAGNTFTSTGLSPATTYYYWIYSYNGATSCATLPKYRMVLPLTGNGTTSSCATATTLYWRGKSSTNTSVTTSVDFNLATNWSLNPTTYSNPSALVPTACTDIVMNTSLTSGNTDITFSQPATVVRSLTSNFNASGSGSLKSFKFIILNQTVTVLGPTSIITNNNGANNSQTEVDVSTGGVFVYGGDLTTSITRVGTGYAYNYPFSNRIPEIKQGKIIIKANALLRGVGNDVTPQLNKPDYLVFDGMGTQTITNENVFEADHYDAIHLGHHTMIGELNTPTVVFTGSGSAGFTTVEDLSIKEGAVLDIQPTQKFNRLTAGGTFVLGPGGKLKIDGTSGGETGSSFPWGFSNHTFDATSTVEYSSAAGSSQTIFSPVTYGNLVLSNNSGTGTTTKNLTADITGIKGNLTVSTGTVFNQNTFNANRSTPGGTFALTGTAVHKLSGTSGGATAGNNYPANYTTISLAVTSTTEYNGAAQTIYGLPEYGNFSIANAGIKTAPAGTLVIKGNLENSGATFAHNNGKVLLNGTNQSFAGLAFYELQLGANGIKSLTSTGSVEERLALNPTTALTMALGNNDFTIKSTSSKTAHVAEIPSSASLTYGTGRFIVERFMPAKKAWRFVATPVKAGTKIFDTWQEGGSVTAGKGIQITGPGAAPATNGLDVTSASNSIKYYNPANNSFTMVSNTRTTDLANDKGYMVFVRGDRLATVASGLNNTTVLRTRGELITGTKTYTVPAVGIASVGNPYASRIDLTKVFDNGGIGGVSNVTAAFTIWDPQVGTGVNGVGRYRTYSRNNSGNFELTPEGTINNFIESGQAFYVQSHVGGTLTLQENVKANGSSNAARGGEPLVMRRLRTNLWGPDPDSTSALIDGTLNDFDEGYSNAFDNMDVRKTANTNENIGITLSGKNLIVERRKPFVATDTIFYTMSGMKQQTYRFVFVPQNLSPLLSGFLEDAYLHTSTPVSLVQNTTVFFTVTSVAASAASNRFRMVFKPAAVLPVTITSVSANRNSDRSIAVNWKVENEINMEKYTVERSADGISFVGIITAAPSNSNSYTKNDMSPLAADNFYRIKAQSIGGNIQYSAIVKVAPEKTNSQISVYPNPVVDKKVQVQFAGQKKGSYQLQLSSKLGQLIWQGSAQVSGSNFVKMITLSENTPAGTYQLKISNDEHTAETIQVVIQ